jgi:flagellum-specific peptidoglycan hydrolase FlgJ
MMACILLLVTTPIRTSTGNTKLLYEAYEHAALERANSLVELNLYNLYNELKKQNIAHPDIVLAQAVFETAWFSSDVCIHKHNCFGLVDSSTNSYFEFDNWQASVAAYKNKVQNKYNKHMFCTYYKFLQHIGYAADSHYIAKVKTVHEMVTDSLAI